MAMYCSPKNRCSICLSWCWRYTFLRLYFFIFPPAVVAAPTPTKPQCCSLTRGFHRAVARFQDESRSDKPSSTYHEHYQAHSAKQDTGTASSEDSAYEAETEETYRANTRSVETTVLRNVRINHNVLQSFLKHVGCETQLESHREMFCVFIVTRTRVESTGRSTRQRSSFKFESWMLPWSLFRSTAGQWKLLHPELKWVPAKFTVKHTTIETLLSFCVIIPTECLLLTPIWSLKNYITDS